MAEQRRPERLQQGLQTVVGRLAEPVLAPRQLNRAHVDTGARQWPRPRAEGRGTGSGVREAEQSDGQVRGRAEEPPVGQTLRGRRHERLSAPAAGMTSALGVWSRRRST